MSQRIGNSRRENDESEKAFVPALYPSALRWLLHEFPSYDHVTPMPCDFSCILGLPYLTPFSVQNS